MFLWIVSVSAPRGSHWSPLLITFRVEGSSLRDLARDLSSALLPLSHSESMQRFFPVFLHDPPRGSVTLEHVEEREETLMSPLVSEWVLSTPECSSRPSRKSSSRAVGYPVAVCCLWSREMGEVQLFRACCVLDTTYPRLLQAHRRGDWGAAVLRFGKGHPSCRRTELGFKPGLMSKPGPNSAWSLVYTATLYLRFLSSLDLIFIETVSVWTKIGFWSLPGCTQLLRPDWLKLYRTLICVLPSPLCSFCLRFRILRCTVFLLTLLGVK